MATPLIREWRWTRSPRRVAVVVGVVAGLLAMLAHRWPLGPWFDQGEYKNYDDLVRQHALYKPCQDLSRVIIIAIDPDSEKQFGRFPWPRTRDAELVRELKRVGFTVIGMDLILDRPSLSGPEDDRALAQAASDAGNVVWQSFYPDSPDLEGPDLKGPLPVLKAARESLVAFANVDEDPDHVARSVRAGYSTPQQTVAPFSVVVAERYLDLLHNPRAITPPEFFRVRGGALKTRWFSIPLDSRCHFPIRYSGPAHGTTPPNGTPEIRHVSAMDVADLPDDFFKGKIALVGRWDQLDPDNQDNPQRKIVDEDLHRTPYTAVANLGDPMHDPKADPLEGRMYGVEIEAQAVLAVLDRQFIRSASLPVTLLIVVLIAVLSALITASIPPWLAVLPLAAIDAAYLLAAHSLFLRQDYWLELYVVPFATILSYTGVVCARAILEARERARTLALFTRYVAPQVAKRLLQDPQALTLGAGKTTQVSILCCDIRNFAARSEELFPYELLTWLTTHLEWMVEAIHGEEGTVDKYMGDAIMAVFGAPEPQPDHAARAIRAARAMSDRLDELNRQREAAGTWPYEIGIAIHTGEVVAGSIGHHARPEYAVLGDTVNTAFRTESLTKTLGCRIVITQETLDAAGEAAGKVRAAGSMLVHGRQKPVVVYILSPDPDVEPPAPRMRESDAEIPESGLLAVHDEFARGMIEIIPHPGDG